MGEGPATVLVVDDNEDLLDLAAAVVGGLGCGVLWAREGGEAMRYIEDAAQPVDLLLTDIAMPAPYDGYELARRAKAVRPKLKVIYVTGFSGQRIDGTEGETFGPILQKPYRPSKLAEEIKRALDGA